MPVPKKKIVFQEVERVAIRDIGLLPWQFEAMTLQEYFDYADGVQTRGAKDQEPLRLIYWVLKASNSKKAVPYSDIIKQWPLYTDRKIRDSVPHQEKRSSWNDLKALEEVVKKHSNNDAGGIQNSNDQRG
jgi:hypothetical protein